MKAQPRNKWIVRVWYNDGAPETARGFYQYFDVRFKDRDTRDTAASGFAIGGQVEDGKIIDIERIDPKVGIF